MKTFLAEDEVDQICETARSSRDSAVLYLLRDTGVRVSELVSIRTENVDLRSRSAVIRTAKVRQFRRCPECRHKNGRRVDYCAKCGETLVHLNLQIEPGTPRRRIISFSEDASHYITRHLEGRKADSDWLFDSPGDPENPLSTRAVQNIVSRTAERAGFGGLILDHPDYDTRHRVSPHRLRDAMAVKEFRKKPDLEGIRILAHRLGHKNPNTTYQHYLKIIATETETGSADPRPKKVRPKPRRVLTQQAARGLL